MEPCRFGHTEGRYEYGNCIGCAREYNRERYKANSEKIREQVRVYSRKARGQLEAPTRPEPEGCEICGMPDARTGWRLSEDHCKVTGKFRGWLCGTCNRAIGMLGDSLPGLLRAAGYLTRFELE